MQLFCSLLTKKYLSLLKFFSLLKWVNYYVEVSVVLKKLHVASFPITENTPGYIHNTIIAIATATVMTINTITTITDNKWCYIIIQSNYSRIL